MADTETNSYNKFTAIPQISYNCIKYLMDNDDEVWKLLKYTEPDAWKSPSLSKAEKGDLIYKGQDDETKYRVFMDVGADNSWTVEACILRISPVSIVPTNYVYGYITMGFEVYCHYKINHLSNYQTRIETITQRLIEIFNGAEVGGLGRLYYDYNASSASKSMLIGSIPYKGRVTILCNQLA